MRFPALILLLIHLAKRKEKRSMSTTYEFYAGRKTAGGKIEATGLPAEKN